MPVYPGRVPKLVKIHITDWKDTDGMQTEIQTDYREKLIEYGQNMDRIQSEIDRIRTEYRETTETDGIPDRNWRNADKIQRECRQELTEY